MDDVVLNMDLWILPFFGLALLIFIVGVLSGIVMFVRWVVSRFRSRNPGTLQDRFNLDE
jgi:hypothetical protein